MPNDLSEEDLADHKRYQDKEFQKSKKFKSYMETKIKEIDCDKNIHDHNYLDIYEQQLQEREKMNKEFYNEDLKQKQEKEVQKPALFRKDHLQKTVDSTRSTMKKIYETNSLDEAKKEYGVAEKGQAEIVGED
jgi:Na+-translocating ferredoxin:NAD+ oxidoreductase RnfC subunit